MDQENDKSLFEKVCEVSNTLCDVRTQINIQRLEILKYENLLKERNGSLRDLNDIKSSLKQKRNNLLTKISHDSQSEDESELLIGNVKVEQAISLNQATMEYFNDFTNKSEDNQISCTDSLSDISIDNWKNISLKSNSSIEINNNKLIPDIYSQLLQNKEIRKPQPDSEFVDNHSKKIEVDNLNSISRKRNISQVDSNSDVKKQKMTSTISCILQFPSRELFCVAHCAFGILFGGSEGLLQLRDQQSLENIRKYKGHDKETVEKVIIINDKIIGSCSKRRFVAFNLETANVLKTIDFSADVVCLKELGCGIFIATNSKYHYLLSKKTFGPRLQIRRQNVITAFVPIHRSTEHISILCSSGKISSKEMSVSSWKLDSRQLVENQLDYIALFGDHSWLSYSTSTVTVNLNEHQTMQTFDQPIRKVCSIHGKIFVVLADGKVLVNRITDNVCDWASCETYDTQDQTLRDIYPKNYRVYLIGDHNVYTLKYRWF